MKPTATLGGGQMKVTVFMIIVGIIFLCIFVGLLNHGISVDECTVTKESLEDYFNEKMRGGIVNA